MIECRRICPASGPRPLAASSCRRDVPRYGTQPEGSPAVLWATDEPAEDLAEVLPSLRDPARRLGLVPVQLSGLAGKEGDRPWDSREFSPAPPGGTAAAAGELLASWWSMGVPDPEEDEDETAELLSPFGRGFPGLAPAVGRALTQAELRSALTAVPLGRLGLVAAERPADVLAVLGWHGAVNYEQDGDALSIVLRSWDERFGAELVAVGFDTIQLLVARPPRTLDDAQRIAAEHFAFCSDSVYQGAGSISQLANDLIDGPIWSLWWD